MPAQPPDEDTPPWIPAAPAPCRSTWRCSSSTRVWPSGWPVNVTSISLACAGSGSRNQSSPFALICHENTIRCGGSHANTLPPVALAAVHAALVVAAADAGFEYGLGEVGSAEVVLVRPPRVVTLGEEGERLVGG